MMNSSQLTNLTLALTSEIKEQFLLFCPHTFPIKVLGRSFLKIKEIHLE